MKLVIVESPTKAKTLSKFLPKEYTVAASNGHIRDLPKSGLGVDVEKNFEPIYEVPTKANKTLTSLKKDAKKAKEIILATDPDREGEAIAWHLKELLTPKKGKREFGRVVFHELTESAIKKAFDEGGSLDMNLVNAQQARRVLDRLVGYKLSPLLWKKVMYGLSAGRVQSVAIRLIVERERERDVFDKEEYWDVKVDFTDDKDKREFTAEVVKGSVEIKSEKEAKQIEGDLRKDSFEVGQIKKTERRKKPNAPFKTSTLQQTCSNALGFTARKTMGTAQKLFEKGFITYHRTDSLSLSPQFVTSVRSFIKKEFGKEYFPKSVIHYKTKGKNAQEAHEAIRVTNVDSSPKKKLGLTGEELKVYKVIWKRCVECQMEHAIYDQTTIHIDSEKGYKLRAGGSVVKFEGWLAVSSHLSFEEDATSEIKALPEYSEEEKLKLVEVIPEQHFTQPPGRFSDATLIKKLEELGIGRPSTYAPTISTIQTRGYIEKENRYFIPRDVAFVVSDLLMEHFPEIVDYNFTALMEEELDAIANEGKEWVPIIREFYEPFNERLEIKEKELHKRDVTNLGDSDEKCPDCGKVLVYKLGKYGKFLSCSGYPKCEYAKPLPEDVSDEELNKDYGKCTECDDGVFILKQGRFGKFLACSNYPKCKTTKTYLEKIGMKCPECKDGDIVVKKAKKRTFFGCSKYPDCEWSSWKDPRGVPKEDK